MKDAGSTDRVGHHVVDMLTSAGTTSFGCRGATLSGPIPARVLRAARFHEFVEQLLQWGTQGEVSYVPRMRTQLVAAARLPRRSPI